jgi:FkbM family methyltransferase
MHSFDLRGATVVDVGANRGIYSYWMHRAARPNGHVIAFEPQPELVTYLQDLKASFALDRLSIVAAGLSSRPGTAQLVRPKTHWGGASLDLDPREDTDLIEIEIQTLDDYFESSDVRPVRFIKADIQDHEYECFVGGERLLREDRPALLFESEDTKIARIVPFLESLDYRVSFLTDEGRVPFERLAGLRETIQAPYLNYVAVPAEGV